MVCVVADAAPLRAPGADQLPQPGAEVGPAEHHVEHQPRQHEHDRKRLQHDHDPSSMGERESRTRIQATAHPSARYTAANVAYPTGMPPAPVTAWAVRM